MYTTGDENKCEIQFFIYKYTVIPPNPNTPKVGFADEAKVHIIAFSFLNGWPITSIFRRMRRPFHS